MKKTLLIAGAALLASVIASQAQVYSQNIVGYVNVQVPSLNFVLIANQLDTGSNTLNNVFQSGLVDGATTVNIWTGTSYHQYAYYAPGDLDATGGWYDYNTLAPATGVMFPVGTSAFMRGGGTATTVTTVGNVLTGTNTLPIAVGPGLHFNFMSYLQPLGSTSPDSLNLPSNPSVADGNDKILLWTGSNYYQTAYYAPGDLDANGGWYDYNTLVRITNGSPVWPPAGIGFVYQNNSGVSQVWTNVFNP